MSIDHDMLARHNLNRFGCKIVITPDDDGEGPTYMVHTFPVRDNGVINNMLDAVHGIVEDGATEATVTLHSDGSLQCRGFKPGNNTQLIGLLAPGRDRFLNSLEVMFDEGALNKAVDLHAREIVFGDLTLEQLDEVKAHCPESHAGLQPVQLLSDMVGANVELMTVPGALCNLPGDFQAEFNRQREETFPGLVRDYLLETLPEVEEKMREKLDLVVTTRAKLEKE